MAVWRESSGCFFLVRWSGFWGGLCRMVRFFSCLWSRAGESILMGMAFPGAGHRWWFLRDWRRKSWGCLRLSETGFSVPKPGNVLYNIKFTYFNKCVICYESAVCAEMWKFSEKIIRKYFVGSEIWHNFALAFGNEADGQEVPTSDERSLKFLLLRRK